MVQPRQHQRGALVRADSDSGAGQHIAGQRVARSPCRRESRRRPDPATSPDRPAHCGCRAQSFEPAAGRGAGPAPRCRCRRPTTAGPAAWRNAASGICSVSSVRTSSSVDRPRSLPMPSTASPWSPAKIDDLRRIERRLQGVLDQAELNRERFEFAHAAGCVAAALQLPEERLLQRHVRDRGDDGTLEGHRSSLQARKRR